MSDIKEFYKAIAEFISVADDQLKLEIIQCFRCILLGGKPLPVLQGDIEEANSKKYKVPITDTAFNQKVLRESLVVNIITRQL